MSARPEGSAGGYEDIEPYDPDAWRDFTPWRPGDKPESDPVSETPTSDSILGFKWTEGQPVQFNSGDRVQNTRAIGGMLGSAVPKGTIGYVRATRASLLGDAYATVEFDNGYREEVRAEDIERKGWF